MSEYQVTEIRRKIEDLLSDLKDVEEQISPPWVDPPEDPIERNTYLEVRIDELSITARVESDTGTPYFEEVTTPMELMESTLYYFINAGMDGLKSVERMKELVSEFETKTKEACDWAKNALEEPRIWESGLWRPNKQQDETHNQ